MLPSRSRKAPCGGGSSRISITYSTPAQVEALPPLAREHITTYAYLWKGHWVHGADHAIFTNHSDTPNSYGVYPNADVFGWSVASRDIAKGEEITEDYRTFCDDWQSYPFLKHVLNGAGMAPASIHAA